MTLKSKMEKAIFLYKRQEEINYIQKYEKQNKSLPSGALVGLVFNYSRETGARVMRDFNQYL